jgi:hypothetical protein
MKLTNSLSVFFLLFITLGALVFLSQKPCATFGISTGVLHWANFICLFLNVGAFYIQKISLQSSNPKTFILAAMGTITAKLLIAMLVAISYISVAKATVNKLAVVIGLLFYLAYMVVEVYFIFKILSAKKNG